MSAGTDRTDMEAEKARAPIGKRHGLVSPVDLPASPEDETETRPLLWASMLIATAALFLALFNAVSLVGWARDLPPSAASARVVAAVERWYDLTDDWGLTAPGEAVRHAYDRIKAARFPGRAEAQAGAPPAAEEDPR